MKIKNILVGALAGAMTLLSPVCAFAADAAEENITPLTVEGLEYAYVSSSILSDFDRIGEKENLSNIYDMKLSTGISFTFEKGQKKSVSLYTALSTPAVLDRFGVAIGGEKGTVVAIKVFATNDNQQPDDEWYQLDVINPAEDVDGYKVFEVADFVRKFRYYRFDFTVLQGEGFTLGELAILKEKTNEIPLVYKTNGEVLPGETPELVPAYEAKKEVDEWEDAAFGSMLSMFAGMR